MHRSRRSFPSNAPSGVSSDHTHALGRSTYPLSTLTISVFTLPSFNLPHTRTHTHTRARAHARTHTITTTTCDDLKSAFHTTAATQPNRANIERTTNDERRTANARESVGALRQRLVSLSRNVRQCTVSHSLTHSQSLTVTHSHSQSLTLTS